MMREGTKMNRQHYKVVNPIRFFIFILITILVITFAAVTILNHGKAEASAMNTYMQVVVEDHDSLWSIAEGYCSRNMDMRDFIDDICEINDINVNDYLQPGDVVFIPLY